MSGPHQDPFRPNPLRADPFGGAPFGQGPPQAGPPVFSSAPPSVRPPTNTFAILSVVLAFVFAPAGAALAHLGLAQIHRTGQPGRRVAITGLVLSYSVIVVTVVAVVAALSTGSRGAAPVTTTAHAPIPSPQSSAAPPPPPTPTVAPADLAGLLPSAEEMKNLLADPNLKLVQTKTALAPLPGSLDRQECWSTFAMGDARGYDAAAARGFYATSYDEPHPDITGGVYEGDQGVVAETDAAAAQSALQRLLADWRSCGVTTVRYSNGGPKIPLVLSAPSDAGGGVTTLTVDWGDLRVYTMFFVRAVAAKANVVVDVTVSGRPAPTAQAVAIANAIVNKIP